MRAIIPLVLSLFATAAMAQTPDLSAPPAPTNIGASVVSTQGKTTVLKVTWTDNTTQTDEFNTCFWFYTGSGAPVTTQCAFAGTSYDATGTGTRTAQIVVPREKTYIMKATTARWVQLDGGKLTVNSAFSASKTVCAWANHC